MPQIDRTIARAAKQFEQRYGTAPKWIAAAPGRVNLIGEHIDYNDGFVLPMAIDRYCVVAAADSPTGTAHIYSAQANEEAQIQLAIPGATGSASAAHKKGRWSNYVAGVIAGCEKAGLQPDGFNAVIDSDVPLGGGLSSSAAIEVATATLIEAMTGKRLDPVQKALLCQRAEHDYAGVPCGIMDQFASVLCRADHLMLLDCRSQDVEHIPFGDTDITVLIINTNVKHELSGGEYAERRAQCESAAQKLGVRSLRDATVSDLEESRQKLTDLEYRRAWHVITEITRTLETVASMASDNWERVGNLMYASHESLRVHYEVSCPELDLLVNLARNMGPAGGMIGSRMTGGGFGGCTVSLVKTESVERVAQHIAASYCTETGIEPTILTSRPAQGAHIVRQ